MSRSDHRVRFARVGFMLGERGGGRLASVFTMHSAQRNSNAIIHCTTLYLDSFDRSMPESPSAYCALGGEGYMSMV